MSQKLDKIALLIGGRIGRHDVAVKSWKIHKWENVDSYFSVWDRTLQTNRGLNILVDRKESYSSIKIGAKIQFWKERDFQYNSNLRKQMHHWQILINGIYDDYGLVILTRPELYYELSEDIFRNFLETIDDKLYTLTYYPEISHIDDTLLIAKPRVFKDFIQAVEFSEITQETRVHNWLHDKFISNGIGRIVGIKNIALCRETCDYNDSFETIRQKQIDWNKNL